MNWRRVHVWVVARDARLAGTGGGRRPMRPVAVALGALAVLAAAAPVALGAEGDISTVAGTGTAGFAGDGGSATAAQLNVPSGVAATADGGFLIADSSNHRVRKVSSTGTITTVAGTGVAGSSGDAGPATSAQLRFPIAVAVTADGGYLISEQLGNRIRKVSSTGTISTVAGTGVAGFSGDGGAATSAELSNPIGVAATADGGFLIADFSNSRIRKVSSSGTISTVAGTGGGCAPSTAACGDGGAATAAQLSSPSGVAATADGGFLIADLGIHRVRKVAAAGTITTVAGTGTGGYNGDNQLATAANLSGPTGVATTADGGFLVAEGSHRVRRVSAGGTITTLAGTGTACSPTTGPCGDGGPATAARLNGPFAAAAAADGDFLIADTGTHRIREVDGAPVPPDLTIEKDDSVDPVAPGGNLVYTLTVENEGVTAATDVTVTDTLPGGVSFVQASGGGIHNSGVVSWNLGTIQPSDQLQVTVEVTVPANRTTVLVNNAETATAVVETDLGDNQTTEQTDVMGWIVTNDGDAVDGSGCTVAHCTLREAIVRSNSVPGDDTITFGIQNAAGPWTISPLSPLPSLTDEVTIDAGCVRPKPILLSGAVAGGSAHGLVAVAGQTTIRGLAINGFALDGIRLQGSGDLAEGENRIVCNYIGIDRTGETAVPNGQGIEILDSPRNVVGGSAAGDGNVISANTGRGIFVGIGDEARENRIQGNLIGTDADGVTDLGNGVGGIGISSRDNLVGGSAAGERNLISGNDGVGVMIGVNTGVNARTNRIEGNRIGTDTTGEVALGNASEGILVANSPETSIGGSTSGAGNLISANGLDGVRIDGATSTDTSIQGNRIGTDDDGESDLGNLRSGVLVNAPATSIGGANALLRNLISGNAQQGINVLSPGQGGAIQGNYIGTDASGAVALGNDFNGIRVAAANNLVGGIGSNRANVLSGNGTDGLQVAVGGDGVRVHSNLIGVNAAGTAALGNARHGVFVGGSLAVIGGGGAGEDNVISGNSSAGVLLDSTAATAQVQGNWIGTNANGDILGNGSSGVSIQGAQGALVGGATGAAGNEIAFNDADGVTVLPGSEDDRITANQFRSNDELGIDLHGDGVTANDPGDADAGENLLQNFPIVDAAVSDTGAGQTVIEATLDSAAGTYRLDAYSSTTCDPSGNGEGQHWLGTANVTPDAQDEFVASIGEAASLGSSITVTATDGDGNTSELSPCRTEGPPDLVINKRELNPHAIGRLPGETFSYEIEIDNAGISEARRVTVSDALPSNLNFVAASDGGSFDSGTRTVTWMLGTVTENAPAKKLTLMVQLAPAYRGDSWTNTAQISTSTPERDLGDNADSVTTPPRGADLTIEKSAPPTVIAGEAVTYELAISNSGPLKATNATVSDALPGVPTYDGPGELTDPRFCVGAGCTPDSPWSGSVNLGEIVRNAGATIRITAGVPASADCDAELLNVAEVHSDQEDPAGTGNSDGATSAIDCRADLSITKSGPAVVQRGVAFEYGITVSNAGPSDARGVTLTDTLPQKVTSSSWSGSADLGRIRAGQTQSVTIAATGIEEAGDVAQRFGEPVTNTASVGAATPDPEGGNDSAAGQPTKICTRLGTDGPDLLQGTGAHELLCGLAGNDTLTGGGGNDVLEGDAGDDRLEPGTGRNHIDGGGGRDRLAYPNPVAVGVSLRGGVTQDRDTGNLIDDTIAFEPGLRLIDSTVEDVEGSDSRDNLDGDAAANRLWGMGCSGCGAGSYVGDVPQSGDILTGAGENDLLQGSVGHDGLRGGPGNDILKGGAGNDLLGGAEDPAQPLGSDNDTLEGGPGNDVAFYLSSPNRIRASLVVGPDYGATGEGRDEFSDIENLRGSARGDILLGDGDSNLIEGGGGDDTIRGNGGADDLRGGGEGDSLYGDAGIDSLNGGDDNDRLEGGLGSPDVHNGGPGKDKCVSTKGEPRNACES